MENNEINQQVASEILQQFGCLVSVAGDGDEAVEMVRDPARTFDAVLMDLQMPRMDGYQATRAIRSDVRFCSLPIIAMTADAIVGVRELCLQAGMNDYATKPIDPVALHEVLAKWTAGTPSPTPRPSDESTIEIEDQTIDIPGIDVEAALARLGGKTSLLVKLLASFRDHHADLPKRIRSHLAENNLDQATLEAHTLKGVAGNIGAKDLAIGAGILHSRLVDGDRPAQRTALVNVEVVLANLLDSLEQLPEPSREPDFEGEPVDVSEEALQHLGDQLDGLRSLLEDDDMESAEYLKKLLETAPASFRPRLEVLGKQMDSFDFARALATVDNLTAEVESTLDSLGTDR